MGIKPIGLTFKSKCQQVDKFFKKFKIENFKTLKRMENGAMKRQVSLRFVSESRCKREKKANIS